MTSTGTTSRPPVQGLNHIALHVRDVDEAVAFWCQVIGAQPHWFGDPPKDGEHKRLFSVDLAGVVLAFFEMPGLTGWDHEFPHYAFTVDSDQMLTLHDRLQTSGVGTHQIWTRHAREGLVYFRDPTGNLFELFCPEFAHAKDRSVTALDANYGGDFRPPIEAIRYEWNGVPSAATMGGPPSVGVGSRDREAVRTRRG